MTFKNTTGAPATGVKLSVSVPTGWTAVISGSTETSKTFADPVAPGASVSATFTVTSGSAAFNGDLVGNVAWAADGTMQSDSTAEKVRNVSPVKINEFAINATDSFIELYNAGASDVDLSGWTLTEHPITQAIFSAVKIPAGTKLAAKGFYVLGLANSGLAVPAQKGDTTVYVRSTTGLSVGDTIEIDTGAGVETRKIAAVGTAAGAPATLWQPLPDGPVITIPAGSTSVPYGGGGGFAVEVGQKLGLGFGATYPVVLNTVEKYEVVTVTEVGKPGTQTYLAANANIGDTSIRVRGAANISVGDKINLDIDSVGHGIENVTVKSIGAAAGGGRGGGGGASLELEAPLKFNHANNLPFSVRGTGISFQPATAFAHSSNEPSCRSAPASHSTAPWPTITRSTRWCGTPRSPRRATKADTQSVVRGARPLPSAGNMVLRDAAGLVADSLNYGGLVDPWAAEGYQGASRGVVQRPCARRRRPGRAGRSGRPHAQEQRGPFPGRY